MALALSSSCWSCAIWAPRFAVLVTGGVLWGFTGAEEEDAICTCSPGNKLNDSSVLADTCCRRFDCFFPRLRYNPINRSWQTASKCPLREQYRQVVSLWGQLRFSWVCALQP